MRPIANLSEFSCNIITFHTTTTTVCWLYIKNGCGLFAAKSIHKIALFYFAWGQNVHEVGTSSIYMHAKKIVIVSEDVYVTYHYQAITIFS